MFAGSPAKQATLRLAPASPVFAGMPAPTVIALTFRCCARQLSHRYCINLKPARYLWERACPRRIQRGGWHRLRRCSRLKPLPQ
ncbi:hypothetical protein DOH45_26345 [Salmonella enterica subsp. enterica serovar Enteritidis]|nr:hypothetical protein [Salmonella enterica subsp. enterica serovar Enteritidis]